MFVNSNDTVLSVPEFVVSKSKSEVPYLTNTDVKIPNGFAISTNCYDKFLEFNNLNNTLDTILNNIDYQDHINLKRSGLIKVAAPATIEPAS